MEKRFFKIVLIAMSLILASCGSKKAIVKDSSSAVPTQSVGSESKSVKKLSFVQKVSDNQVYTKNITGRMSFNIQSGDKDVTVPGSLHMRKDQVIRMQLFIPILGSEVGRLEFTPDYVLIIDRVHKQYIKADYNKVDFLQKQGISFYSLQALFWNQLLLPGNTRVSESDLKKFDVDMDAGGKEIPVVYSDGNMKYVWNTDASTGRIDEANVSYSSAQHGKSTLNLKYRDFKTVGVKQFPATQNMTLTTNATKQPKTVKINIEMDEVETDSDWDVKTEISSKYKQVQPEDVLGKILNM